jgi:hypothetical protein
MGPRTSLDDLEKRKILPYRESNSDRSVVQPVASRYTDYANPAQQHNHKYILIYISFL